MKRKAKINRVPPPGKRLDRIFAFAVLLRLPSTSHPISSWLSSRSVRISGCTVSLSCDIKSWPYIAAFPALLFLLQLPLLEISVFFFFFPSSVPTRLAPTHPVAVIYGPYRDWRWIIKVEVEGVHASIVSSWIALHLLPCAICVRRIPLYTGRTEICLRYRGPTSTIEQLDYQAALLSSSLSVVSGKPSFTNITLNRWRRLSSGNSPTQCN